MIRLRRYTDQRFKISILGQKEAPKGREKCEYIGMYTEKNISAERGRLQKIMDSCVSKYDCSYKCHTGKVTCDHECLCVDCTGFDHAEKCPEETFCDAKRELSLLNTFPLMRHAFSSPTLATSNDFLKKGGLIYSHQ